MAGSVSPRTSRSYPLSWVCQVSLVPRSCRYAVSGWGGGWELPRKRGPKTPLSDEELVCEIAK